MGATSIHFDRPGLPWKHLWRQIAHASNSPSECIHLRNFWRRLRFPESGVLFSGARYCLARCLETALAEAIPQVRSNSRQAASHRVPLGLILLSRQQVTVEQLQLALQRQRSSGHGRVGDWLKTLGFIDEQQLTTALARQWSCPVLRTALPNPSGKHRFVLPYTLLEHFKMVAVDYLPATSTLHMAFAEGLDHGVLYAIEQMTGCHTKACLAVPSYVYARLQSLAKDREPAEIVFEHVSDEREVCHIIGGYCDRTSASEVRISKTSPYTWARLLRSPGFHLDLLFRLP